MLLGNVLWMNRTKSMCAYCRGTQSDLHDRDWVVRAWLSSAEAWNFGVALSRKPDVSALLTQHWQLGKSLEKGWWSVPVGELQTLFCDVSSTSLTVREMKLSWFSLEFLVHFNAYWKVILTLKVSLLSYYSLEMSL